MLEVIALVTLIKKNIISFHSGSIVFTPIASKIKASRGPVSIIVSTHSYDIGVGLDLN